jgi:hypothetical protein
MGIIGENNSILAKKVLPTSKLICDRKVWTIPILILKMYGQY